MSLIYSILKPVLRKASAGRAAMTREDFVRQAGLLFSGETYRHLLCRRKNTTWQQLLKPYISGRGLRSAFRRWLKC